VNRIGIICVAFVGLAGCQSNPPPHLAGCNIESPHSFIQGPRRVSMDVAGDGQWCSFGWETADASATPFTTGGLLAPPTLGQAEVRTINGRVSIRYRAPAGSGGADEFSAWVGVQRVQIVVAVRVLPTSATLQISPSTALADAGHNAVTLP
jgi:hypothetical protein